MPELSAASQSRIRQYLPAFAATRNPIDVTGQAHSFSRDGVVSVLHDLLESDETDAVLLVGTFGYDKQLLDHEQFPSVLANRRKPLVAFSYTKPQAQAAAIFDAAAVACFPSARRAARALAAVMHTPEPRRVMSATEVVTSRANAGDLRALFADSGVPVNEFRLCRDPAAAVAAAEELGYPVVLKVAAPTIAHKTEVGAVAAGLRNKADVLRAYAEVEQAIEATGAHLELVTVERHLMGHELLVGAVNDPQVGPVLSLGYGGVFVELADDIQFRLPPISHETAHHWLGALRLFPALRDGYRNLPAADLTSLADLLVGFASAVTRYTRPWRAIELNPVIAMPRAAVAVDVLEL